MYKKTLPQTLIIESLDEEGRIKEIRALVKQSLCISNTCESACEKCKSCRLFEKGNHPDLIQITKYPDKKNISINTVRQLILKRINSRPHLSKIICVTIHNAETLSIGAQNSLLKTLEEPPSYVKIILSADKADNLLPTIRSRSQLLTLRNKQNESAENLLEKIIHLDLVKRFQLAKEIAEMDKKQKRKDAKNTLKFIDNLVLDLRAFVKLHADQPKAIEIVLKDIRKALDGRTKISYNVNKQLVLENLLLQSVSNEIYKKLKGINDVGEY